MSTNRQILITLISFVILVNYSNTHGHTHTHSLTPSLIMDPLVLVSQLLVQKVLQTLRPPSSLPPASEHE